MKIPQELTQDEWDLWRDWMEAQRALNREIDRALQAEFGISKAEFSILLTLSRGVKPALRVVDIGAALGWEKSRISHLLKRMEARGLVERVEDGAPGRRTGVKATNSGRDLSARAVKGHARNIRRYFFSAVTSEQASAIHAWSKHMVSTSS